MSPLGGERGVREARFVGRGAGRRVTEDRVWARAERADGFRPRLAACLRRPGGTWGDALWSVYARCRASLKCEEVGGHDRGSDVAGKALLPAPGAAFEAEAALDSS